ncbi:MAG: laminin G domain-containing protein, partial [Armatimonadota bacterium]|nr:laminin G domain-containing protein [Armatimonadota bacterium]
ASVRYIDFEGGDDARDGLTPASAWKHHPWDPAAEGKAAACRGIHTYVFKRGVVYRGTLMVKESGKAGDPIRLTSDPAWGTGEAALYGSVALRGGWTRGADRKEIPEPEKVWWRDLDFAPRNVWMVNAKGEITRIPLARTPNWKVSNPDDVKSEWWEWNYPTGRPFDVFTQSPSGGQLHLGIDTEHLTREKEYYEGAIVWTEYGWVQSTPYPARVEVVDTERKGLGFGGQFGGVGSYHIIKGNRYFLEDKPHYLDDPDGEFWFDKKGEGGRLYLRLPGDLDPNTVQVEAGRHIAIIDSTGMNHIHISGLVFRFTNFFWDLTAPAYRYPDFSRRYELDAAAIRLVGPGQDIRVSNCLFEHLYMAVFMQSPVLGGDIDRVVVADNEIRFTDGGGLAIAQGSLWGHTVLEGGLLKDVKVLRNRLHEVGRRPSRFGMGVAIDVENGETVEIAGNILTRTWGLGINMPGGKRNGASWDVPLVRILCHHNKVIDPLLNNNDFGGIETWQGGPFYVYNNVVGNPGGYQHWNTVLGNQGYKRFGHAYYLDGAFKNYLFNNIGWGKSSDPNSPLGNRSAIQEIISFQNTFFNNTFYNFVKGSRRQAPQGGRNKYLGNVWDTIGDWVFRHADPARTPAAGNERDAGPARSRFALETNAYANNVFHQVKRFATFKPSGQWHESFEEAQQALREAKAIRWEMGVVTEKPPLRDAPAHDFRPAPGSAARGRGVKVFVPWALARVVGEWNFYPSGDDPTHLLDEHWYMTPYYLERDNYYRHPRFPLKGVNITAADYVEDPLEDWVRGALKLNGRNQYLVGANAGMNGPLEYTVVGRWAQEGQRTTKVAEGESFASPQVYRSNFLIEVYFRTEPGCTGGVLVQKRAAEGYSLTLNRSGNVIFSVAGRAATGDAASAASATLTDTRRVNDGRWHHLVAECDRTGRVLTIYLDGKKSATGRGIGPEVSLANNADLYVGGTPGGGHLSATFCFLRIALGTLADAKTDIAELYAWEFDGPFLRDFTGRKPAGARDAGAIHGGS